MDCFSFEGHYEGPMYRDFFIVKIKLFFQPKKFVLIYGIKKQDLEPVSLKGREPDPGSAIIDLHSPPKRTFLFLPLQNMKFLHFFILMWAVFDCLIPDAKLWL
jgi:hypothetical protein